LPVLRVRRDRAAEPVLLHRVQGPAPLPGLPRAVRPLQGAVMARFHALPVAAIDRLTDDSVALTLTVPPALREEFRYAPGQHLALRRTVDGTEVRRTYSICSPAPEPDAEGPSTLRVGVRLVDGGAFSTYALKEVTVGDELEVMTPA